MSSHADIPAELVAAAYATSVTPLDAPLHLLCASDDLVELVFDKIPRWEERGWIDVLHSEYVRALLSRLRQRCAVTSFGKITSPENWKALDSARQMASGPLQSHLLCLDRFDPTRDPRFDISGARLCSMTQALAYKGIIEWTATPDRPPQPRIPPLFAPTVLKLAPTRQCTLGQSQPQRL
ncbi:uncharacterized protein B0H18DRAFT_878860 [Fomitopsis serialis]|uniref:uncharacterized protein n=1 Tax=Fomitopsis serialis TaxID=139415 RepID=UPI002008A490|nr:uncharacterized protein B0H18DRAFT_878860 [Neoantrodia serialis]KAH9923246.1 hypothetical protein B0H18DRAFT_878860 [Neoantrodia serialis]